MKKIQIRRIQIFEFDADSTFYDTDSPGEMLKIEMENARSEHDYFENISSLMSKQLITGEVIEDE